MTPTEEFQWHLSTLDKDGTDELRKVLVGTVIRIGPMDPEFNQTMEQIAATRKHLADLAKKS